MADQKPHGFVGAVENGTATLSYCPEFDRIPICAQAAILGREEI
jgi:hypothetical protein